MNKWTFIVFMTIAFCSSSPAAPDIHAEEPDSDRQKKVGVYILPKSDINTSQAWDKAKLMKDAEIDLAENLKYGLIARGLPANIVKTERSLYKERTSYSLYILTVKVEEVDLGFRGPFGRISMVRARFQLQKQNGAELFSRRYEQTSHKKWKNSTKKISELVVEDVADAIDNKISDRSNIALTADRSKRPKPEDERDDERLRDLKNLRAKGLITEREYRAYRKEVLIEP